MARPRTIGQQLPLSPCRKSRAPQPNSKNMFSKWSSPNQVDFSYVGPGFNGSGFFYGDQEYDDSPAHFTVNGFAGKFCAEQFHKVLFLTSQHFQGLQIRCLYRGAQIEHLEQLASQGLISWRFPETSLGLKEVEILSIVTPPRGRPYVKSLLYRLLDLLKK